MRNERGITLIALVVTIVVLLILAGVTITYALGNNGLFTNAQKAELNSELGNIRDYAGMAKFDVATTFYADKTKVADADGIKAVIQNNFPGYEGKIEVPTSVTAPAGTLQGTITVTLKSTGNPDGYTKATVVYGTDGSITVEPAK